MDSNSERKKKRGYAPCKRKFAITRHLFSFAALFGITTAFFLACGNGDESETGESRFQKGIAFTGYWKDSYQGDDARLALRELRQTKATWTSILVTGYQDTINSTTISCSGDETPTDSSVREIIRYAHQLGLKVMLKPHIDLLYDPQHWRGEIGPNFSDDD